MFYINALCVKTFASQARKRFAAFFHEFISSEFRKSVEHAITL